MKVEVNMNSLQKTQKVLTLAKEKHYRFRVVGEGPMITSEVVKDGWLYKPVERPNLIIATKARERMKVVAEVSQIVGVIEAHELPTRKEVKEWEPPQVPEVVREVAPVVWEVTKTVVVVAAKVCWYTLVGLAYAFSFLAQVDPAIIVVTEDGTWIEVVNWYE